MELLVNRAMLDRDNYAVMYRNTLPKSAKELDAHTSIYDAVINQLANLEDNKEPLTMATQAALVAMSNLSPKASVDSIVPKIYNRESLEQFPETKEYSDNLVSFGCYIPYLIMLSIDEIIQIKNDTDNHCFVTIIFSYRMNHKDDEKHDDFFVSTIDLSAGFNSSNVNFDELEDTVLSFVPIVFYAPAMAIVSTYKEPGVAAGFLVQAKVHDNDVSFKHGTSVNCYDYSEYLPHSTENDNQSEVETSDDNK